MINVFHALVALLLMLYMVVRFSGSMFLLLGLIVFGFSVYLYWRCLMNIIFNMHISPLTFWSLMDMKILLSSN